MASGMASCTLITHRPITRDMQPGTTAVNPPPRAMFMAAMEHASSGVPKPDGIWPPFKVCGYGSLLLWRYRAHVIPLSFVWRALAPPCQIDAYRRNADEDGRNCEG